MNLEEYLKQTVEVKAPHKHPRWKYPSIEEFILKYGRSYQSNPLMKDFKRGVRISPHACYENATRLANKWKELTYVEGVAIGGSSVPQSHAWCVDKDGNVYDCTWHYQDGMEYFGVPVQIEYVNEHTKKTKEYTALESIFLNDLIEILAI